MLSVVAYRLLLFWCGFAGAWLTGSLIRDEIAYERKMRKQMRQLRGCMLSALSRLQTIARECRLARREIEQELGVTSHSEEMRKAALMHLDVVRAAARAAERELESMSVSRVPADSYPYRRSG